MRSGKYQGKVQVDEVEVARANCENPCVVLVVWGARRLKDLNLKTMRL